MNDDDDRCPSCERWFELNRDRFIASGQCPMCGTKLASAGCLAVVAFVAALAVLGLIIGSRLF